MTREVFEHLFVGKAVHCDTEEKAKAFLKLAGGFGYHWRSSESLLEEDYWFVYKEETCYSIGVGDGRVGYADAEWFKEHSYAIVEFVGVTGTGLEQINTLKDILKGAFKQLKVGKMYDLKYNILSVDAFSDLRDAHNLIEKVMYAIGAEEEDLK